MPGRFRNPVIARAIRCRMRATAAHRRTHPATRAMRLNMAVLAEISRACVVNDPVNDKDQIESPGQEHFPNFPLALRLQGGSARVSRPRHIATGKWNVAEMADIAGLSRPSARRWREQAHCRRVPFPHKICRAPGFAALTSVPVEQWRALAETRDRTQRLLSAGVGTGRERNGTRPHRRRRAQRLARCFAESNWRRSERPGKRTGAADRPVAGRLAVARLQDPPARFGEREPLRHAVHAAARSRRCRGSRERLDERGARARARMR